MTGAPSGEPRRVPTPTAQTLIVVPCFNEAAYIERLLSWLKAVASRTGAFVVVVDGGSQDGTAAMARALAGGRVAVIDNPRRTQCTAMNLAMRELGRDVEFLIRIDAHGGYPDDYCDQLLAEAGRTGADAVVVSMETRGAGVVQRAAAIAQNSRIGTGGSSHRHASRGKWVDHGHHALMRAEAFRAVGGYDEAFTHNEDAELDFRLRQQGFRIWLTAQTRMTYFPRATLSGLFRQYLAYGRGRARNFLKHRATPRLRQVAPLFVAPAAFLSAFSFVFWPAAVPLAGWAGMCLLFGLSVVARKRDVRLGLAGLSVMVMHFAWSLGFWCQLLSVRLPRKAVS